MKLDPYFTPLRKIKSKWINNLNVRLEIIKLLIKDNLGKLSNNGFADDLWMLFQKQTQQKQK